MEFIQPAAVPVDDHQTASGHSVPHMMLSGIAGPADAPPAAEINAEEGPGL